MTSQPDLRPTDAELEILKVLWERGPSTVRQVQDELVRMRATGYTTVLKLLQIMTDKGLVTRDEGQRAHVYEASHSEEHTQSGLLGHLLERAFSGSAGKLVMRALADKKASREELEAIRQLLDQLEKQDRGERE